MPNKYTPPRKLSNELAAPQPSKKDENSWNRDWGTAVKYRLVHTSLYSLRPIFPGNANIVGPGLWCAAASLAILSTHCARSVQFSTLRPGFRVQFVSSRPTVRESVVCRPRGASSTRVCPKSPLALYIYIRVYVVCRGLRSILVRSPRVSGYIRIRVEVITRAVFAYAPAQWWSVQRGRWNWVWPRVKSYTTKARQGNWDDLQPSDLVLAFSPQKRITSHCVRLIHNIYVVHFTLVCRIKC